MMLTEAFKPETNTYVSSNMSCFCFLFSFLVMFKPLNVLLVIVLRASKSGNSLVAFVRSMFIFLKIPPSSKLEVSSYNAKL